MSVQQPDYPTITGVERALVDYVAAHVRLVDGNYRAPAAWRYPTPSHLLLAEGRLFTPGAPPAGIGKLPDQFCFANAARTARRHGLIYAEGIAATLVSSTALCLSHAWCVTSDGTVIDPTWDPGAGAAYLGIAISSTSLRPAGNQGVLDDYLRGKELLRNGLPPGDLARLDRVSLGAVEFQHHSLYGCG